MKSVDLNYRAKLAARANGTTPVIVTSPADVSGKDSASVDARYRAKLAARAALAAAPAVAPKVEAKPAPKAEAPVEPKPEAKVEQSSSEQSQYPQRQDDRGKHHHRR